MTPEILWAHTEKKFDKIERDVTEIKAAVAKMEGQTDLMVAKLTGTNVSVSAVGQKAEVDNSTTQNTDINAGGNVQGVGSQAAAGGNSGMMRHPLVQLAMTNKLYFAVAVGVAYVFNIGGAADRVDELLGRNKAPAQYERVVQNPPPPPIDTEE